MNKLHAKSPCCQEKIYHFGNRRRQCSRCKQTWRIRKKKRGRKSEREGSKFSIRYLKHEIPSIYARSRATGESNKKLKDRLRRSLNYFLSHSNWPTLPKNEPLIAVADAAIQFIEGKLYTFHFILIRRINESYAFIAKPYIRQGSEVAAGWDEAFELLPNKTKDSITAVVCDGHGGLTSLAKKHRWIIQRCQFHLIARIQSRRSKWKLSRHKEEGRLIYNLVKEVLVSLDDPKIQICLSEIKKIALLASSSWELKTTLLGFTKHYQDYRTYLNYPKLNLPRTSNSAESLIGGIRYLCHRARGFRTLLSLTKWIHAFLKNKQKFKCNGHNFQPN